MISFIHSKQSRPYLFYQGSGLYSRSVICGNGGEHYR